MNKQIIVKLKRVVMATMLAVGISSFGPAMAEAEWMSFTMDNDTFVGNDNGYTNGMFFSWYDGPSQGEKRAEIGFLAQAMKWSLPDGGSTGEAFSIGTISQLMITPDDIEEDPPILPPDDLPYGGMLSYTDTFVQVFSDHADIISVTLGVVGEYSFAEDAQKGVHELIDSDEPCCWDDQLDDEIVFQLSRSRVWKTWVSDSGNSDLLTHVDLALGTIASRAGAGFMVRHGRNLRRSFAAAGLYNSRVVNPVASQSGWYLFAGARASYLANHIFLDTSKSYDDDFDEIDYQEDRISATVGIAYSWKEWSFTFAMNDLNVDEDDDAAEDYSEYGTFTIAWKLD